MTDFNLAVNHLKPSFPLGQIVMTATAMSTLLPEDVHTGLARHAACDWGDVCSEDRDTNDSAIWGGLRLLSVYHDRNAVTFWIITEADRSATNVELHISRVMLSLQKC